MAKTTVDLVLLLKALNNPDNEEKMASITVWANGSYTLCDSEGKEVLDSDSLTEGYTACDVHGLLYMTVPQITKLVDSL